MLDWIVEMKGIKRDDAYFLASAAMDLTVTQVVDGTKGIHAMLPKSILSKTSRFVRFAYLFTTGSHPAELFFRAPLEWNSPSKS